MLLWLFKNSSSSTNDTNGTNDIQRKRSNKTYALLDERKAGDKSNAVAQCNGWVYEPRVCRSSLASCCCAYSACVWCVCVCVDQYGRIMILYYNRSCHTLIFLSYVSHSQGAFHISLQLQCVIFYFLISRWLGSNSFNRMHTLHTLSAACMSSQSFEFPFQAKQNKNEKNITIQWMKKKMSI